MTDSHELEVAGNRFVLRGDRTLYLPDFETLLLADLHLGKAETFQSFGMAIPSGTQQTDLERLGRAARTTGAKRIAILGDMVHARAGLTEKVLHDFGTWRVSIDAELVLIRGNHDRALTVPPPEWKLEIVPENLPLGNLLLRHHPDPVSDVHVIAGHLHPVTKIGSSRGDALRLPCFTVAPNLTVLPAFTHLAGGYRVHQDLETSVFITTENHITPL